MTKEANH